MLRDQSLQQDTNLNFSILIEERISDQHAPVLLDATKPIHVVIDELVAKFALPRRNFSLRPIKYKLIRAIDNSVIKPKLTLQRAGIAEGELLLLVSPEGRRVFLKVRKLLEEIESEIIDKFTGEIKDRITKAVWKRVTKKLDEIEKTLTGGERVERMRQWVEDLGGPTKVIGIFESLSRAVFLLVTLGIVGAGAVFIIQSLQPSPYTPEPTYPNRNYPGTQPRPHRAPPAPERRVIE